MNNSDFKQTVREADFGDFLRHQLDEQSPPLPPHVSQSLRKARVKALTQHGTTPAFFMPLWKPVASLATVAVLAVTVMYFDGFAPTAPLLDAEMDAELLFSDEGFQFYEDLEFYRWLANNNL